MLQLNKIIWLRYMDGDDPEPANEAVQLLANSIDYKIAMDAGVVYGLAESDFVNWYMKPVNITIKGDSIISSNPMLTSDNIILAMYQKLKSKLSAQNYNYYDKPLFHLFVENGFQDFSVFKGVIKTFDFDEKAKFPNKFPYSITFEGNPYSKVDNGANNQHKDMNAASPSASRPSETQAIRQTRISQDRITGRG
jgi:hypothetical protein